MLQAVNLSHIGSNPIPVANFEETRMFEDRNEMIDDITVNLHSNDIDYIVMILQEMNDGGAQTTDQVIGIFEEALMETE